MGPALDDLPRFTTRSGPPADSGQAMCDHECSPTLHKVQSPCWMISSDSESSLYVASSRIRILGSARIARAVEIRCLWPPDSLTPRFPTIVLYPSETLGNSSTRAIPQRRIFPRSPGARKATLSGFLSNRKDSCSTTPKRVRYESRRSRTQIHAIHLDSALSRYVECTDQANRSWICPTRKSPPARSPYPALSRGRMLCSTSCAPS